MNLFLQKKLLLSLALSSSLVSQAVLRGQAPDPATAVKQMMEQFGKQSQGFMPGMFSELNAEQLKKLENVPISVKEETTFGEQVLRGYEESLKAKNTPFERNGTDVEYLSKLVAKIKPFMRNERRYPQFDIAVVETEAIDAYSVPGGHLIFTTGLLETAGSEAALVGVVAHEMSHLDRGHQLLSLKQQKSMGSMRDMETGMLWISTLAKPFRPEFETQADSDAAQWMMKAGYDARELAHLLERWDMRQDQQQPWTKAVPDFARSHPDSGRRAREVLAAYDKSSEVRRGNKRGAAGKPTGKPAGRMPLIIGAENLRDRVSAP